MPVSLESFRMLCWAYWDSRISWRIHLLLHHFSRRPIEMGGIFQAYDKTLYRVSKRLEEEQRKLEERKKGAKGK
jgi:hypothetical protein